MPTRISQTFAGVCVKPGAAPVQYYSAPVTSSWSNRRQARPSLRCAAARRALAAKGVTGNCHSAHDRFDDGFPVFDDDVEIDLFVSVLLPKLALGISKARGQRVL